MVVPVQVRPSAPIMPYFNGETGPKTAEFWPNEEFRGFQRYSLDVWDLSSL